MFLRSIACDECTINVINVLIEVGLLDGRQPFSKGCSTAQFASFPSGAIGSHIISTVDFICNGYWQVPNFQIAKACQQALMKGNATNRRMMMNPPMLAISIGLHTHAKGPLKLDPASRSFKEVTSPTISYLRQIRYCRSKGSLTVRLPLNKYYYFQCLSASRTTNKRDGRTSTM